MDFMEKFMTEHYDTDFDNLPLIKSCKTERTREILLLLDALDLHEAHRAVESTYEDELIISKADECTKIARDIIKRLLKKYPDDESGC